MKRVSQNPVVNILFKRSASIYNGMKDRAERLSLKMPFTLAEFRFWLEPQFDQDGVGRCAYSDEMILAENFSVDHRTPISRSRFDVKSLFETDNLAICAAKENLRKGNMTEVEYRQFKQHVSRYAPEVQAAIWRKLEVGDVQRFNYFKRKRAAQ